MSDCSNSSSATDSDSDYGEGHVSGTQVGSGTRNTSGSSSVNETQGSDQSPPKALAEYAKGTFDPKKPLLLYATKLVGPSTNKNQEAKEVGHAIGHAIFVAILGLGVIVGLGCTFWA
jgi:hypothetical protein